jgi:hypothetical protein
LRDDEAVSWKNWDIAIPQAVLVIAGGYYIYQAAIVLQSYRVDSLETPASSIISMMIGVILIGLAIMFQQIYKYRERKR